MHQLASIAAVASTLLIATIAVAQPRASREESRVRGTYAEISGLHLIGSRDALPHNLYSENGISFSSKGGEVFWYGRSLGGDDQARGECVRGKNHGTQQAASVAAQLEPSQGRRDVAAGNHGHDLFVAQGGDKMS